MILGCMHSHHHRHHRRHVAVVVHQTYSRYKGLTAGYKQVYSSYETLAMFWRTHVAVASDGYQGGIILLLQRE